MTSWSFCSRDQCQTEQQFLLEDFWDLLTCNVPIDGYVDGQVETYGAMAKTEKIAFILEQVCMIDPSLSTKLKHDFRIVM